MITGLVVILALAMGLLLFVLITDGRYFGKPVIRWVYDHWGASIFGSRSEAARWRDLADQLGLRDDAHLLDVGTAIGDLPLTLAARDGFRGQIVGVDWSPHMITAARDAAQARGLAERVRFEVVDVRDGLPFDDGAFDVVCCFGLLETWPHPDRILAELARVAKPDGALALSLYRGWSAWSARLSRAWYEREFAACGYDAVHVVPSRRSQDVLIARGAIPPPA